MTSAFFAADCVKSGSTFKGTAVDEVSASSWHHCQLLCQANDSCSKWSFTLTITASPYLSSNFVDYSRISPIYIPEFRLFVAEFHPFIPEFRVFFAEFHRFIPEFRLFVAELHRFIPEFRRIPSRRRGGTLSIRATTFDRKSAGHDVCVFCS